jgi:hypothetical protein
MLLLHSYSGAAAECPHLYTRQDVHPGGRLLDDGAQ